MKKITKNFIAAFLAVIFISTPCFARANYSYTTVTTENYVASSPVGSNTTYTGAIPTTNYYPCEHQAIAYNPNATYTYLPEQTVFENRVITSQVQPYANAGNYISSSVDVPQSYNKTVTVTERYVDEREPIDKNIDRAGEIVLVMGGLAIVGGLIAGIFGAFD